MRCTIKFKSKTSTVYNKSDFRYHFRGYLYGNIGRVFPDRISGDKTPVSFSNPSINQNLLEGDEFTVTVSAADAEILNHLVQTIKSRTVYFGDYELESVDIDETKYILPEEGTLTTSTKAVCSVDDDQYDWKRYYTYNYDTELAKDTIESILDYRIDIHTEYSSEERDFDVFDRYIPFGQVESGHQQLTQNQTQYLLSLSWKLPFTIQNDLHREYIKIALRLGIGGKTSIGYGFVTLKPPL